MPHRKTKFHLTASSIIALLIWLAWYGNLLPVNPPPVQPIKNPEKISITNEITPTITNDQKTFLVTRVVDGDTIELENKEKVRYIGIDTPETVHPKKSVQCFGLKAKEKNRELVEGKYVRLEKDISDRDRYGRLLRFVYVGDLFINDYLAREGYARAATFPPDVSKVKQFLEAQAEAKLNQRGLWQECQ